LISREQALETARAWALASLPSGGGEVKLWEFGSAYVAGHVPPARAEGAAPAQLGAPKAVIDKETGELSVWPSLSPERVAHRYEQERSARLRLPEDVREVLAAAGWQSGRDISARINAWASRDAELELFPAAAAALAEFGALRLTAPGSGRLVITWPEMPRTVPAAYASFARDLGQPVYPFAWYEDGPSDAVIARDGSLSLLHPAALYRLGATVEDAITALVRGTPLAEA
jgi:hypothetical protein